MPDEIININFSKNASCYDDHSHVQKECADILLSMLPDNNINSILEIGCGTGSFTKKLAGKYVNADITAVDISEKMLTIAEKRPELSKVNFLSTDGAELPFTGKFDMITANACFQWLKDMESALKYYASCLTEKGMLTFSIYGNRTFFELKDVISAALGGDIKLTSDKFLSLNDLENILKNCFRDYDIFEKSFEMSFSSLLDLMRDIKYSGTRGYGLPENIFIGKEKIAEMESLYRKRRGAIRATHQVFFCKVVNRSE